MKTYRRNISLIPVACVAVLVQALPARAAGAQDSMAVVRLQVAEARCRAEGPLLSVATRRDSAGMILSSLSRCPDQGPAAIASRWRQPPTDSLRLHDMIMASAVVSDERILSTVLEVVGDRTAPRQVRLAALSVMWLYADTTRPIFGLALLNANTPRAITGVSTLGRKVVPGRIAVAGSVRARVAARARELASLPGDDRYVLMALAETADKYKGPDPVR